MFHLEHPEFPLSAELANYYELKADWIEWHIRNPKFLPSSMFLQGLQAHPFRITKEELNSKNLHPNDVGPNGRSGLVSGYETNAGLMTPSPAFIPAKLLKKAETAHELSQSYLQALKEKLGSNLDNENHIL